MHGVVMQTPWNAERYKNHRAIPVVYKKEYSIGVSESQAIYIPNVSKYRYQ